MFNPRPGILFPPAEEIFEAAAMGRIAAGRHRLSALEVPPMLEMTAAPVD
ncbi:hypothetical protein [Azospirillum endophyticum]